MKKMLFKLLAAFMMLFFFAVLVLSIFVWLMSPAHAQSNCGPRLAIIKLLATKYKESPKFIAIAAKENLIEIFISKAGTWTIIITTPQQKTCVIAAGDSWEALPPVTFVEPEI